MRLITTCKGFDMGIGFGMELMVALMVMSLLFMGFLYPSAKTNKEIYDDAFLKSDKRDSYKISVDVFNENALAHTYINVFYLKGEIIGIMKTIDYYYQTDDRISFDSPYDTEVVDTSVSYKDLISAKEAKLLPSPLL